jgi:hypothetical protein
MTDFDRAVLTWLNTASITDRARTVTLGRTSVGIQSYTELLRGDDSTAAIPADALRLDIGLKDIVARAQRRIDDGQPMNLGDLPAPPPPPHSLLTARSGASQSAGPNMRRTGVTALTSRQQSQQGTGASGTGNNNRSSVSRGGINNNNNVNVPLSARSGTLASARGEQPGRPTGVPPLRLQQQRAIAAANRR